jgi:hypothetical protein
MIFLGLKVLQQILPFSALILKYFLVLMVGKNVMKEINIKKCLNVDIQNIHVTFKNFMKEL